MDFRNQKGLERLILQITKISQIGASKSTKAPDITHFFFLVLKALYFPKKKNLF